MNSIFEYLSTIIWTVWAALNMDQFDELLTMELNGPTEA